MTAKEFLNQIRRQEKLLRAVDRERNQIQSDMLNLKCSKLTERVTGTKQSDLSDAYIRLETYEERVNDEWDRLIGLREQGKKLIATVENADQQTILYDRYINCMSWEEIAVGMHYTYRWVLQLHGKALQNLEKDFT
jgi:DNA-directed RNA polymerase specialized sigma subunit